MPQPIFTHVIPTKHLFCFHVNIRCQNWHWTYNDNFSTELPIQSCLEKWVTIVSTTGITYISLMQFRRVVFLREWKFKLGSPSEFLHNTETQKDTSIWLIAVMITWQLYRITAVWLAKQLPTCTVPVWVTVQSTPQHFPSHAELLAENFDVNQLVKYQHSIIVIL